MTGLTGAMYTTVRSRPIIPALDDRDGSGHDEDEHGYMVTQDHKLCIIYHEIPRIHFERKVNR